MNKNSEKGVSLILTFFIMIIILAVVLSVSILLYSQIKVIRNIGNSVVSFYAAESGVEKVLYYDKKVLTYGQGEEQITLERGLCAMFNEQTGRRCEKVPPGEQGETSIYCDQDDDRDFVTELGINGCNPDSCYNCEIHFKTEFDGKTYYTTAKVFPRGGVDNATDFTIESKGVYGTAGREIEISMTTYGVEEAE